MAHQPQRWKTASRFYCGITLVDYYQWWYSLCFFCFENPGMVGLALDQGRLYALRGKLWVLDPSTGEIETVFDTPRASQVIMITHNRILASGVSDEQGRLTAYDAMTGERLWTSVGKVATRYLRMSLVEEIVFFRTETGSLMSVDARTGNLFWEWLPPATAEVVSNFAIINGLVYFLVSDGTLRAVDIHTGEEIGLWQPETMRSWHNAEPSEPIAMPGVDASEDMLFLSLGDRILYAFTTKQ